MLLCMPRGGYNHALCGGVGEPAAQWGIANTYRMHFRDFFPIQIKNLSNLATGNNLCVGWLVR